MSAKEQIDKIFDEFIRQYDIAKSCGEAMDVEIAVLAAKADLYKLTAEWSVTRAGSTKSDAKTRAARDNGTKGGRPASPQQIQQALQCLLAIRENDQRYNKLIAESDGDDREVFRQSHAQQDRVLNNTFNRFSKSVQDAARHQLLHGLQTFVVKDDD